MLTIVRDARLLVLFDLNAVQIDEKKKPQTQGLAAPAPPRVYRIAVTGRLTS